MKAKLITSLLIGSILPWFYFILVSVGQVRYLDQDGNLTKFGSSGVIGFFEYHGLMEAALIYGQSILVCATAIVLVCYCYDFVKTRYG